MNNLNGFTIILILLISNIQLLSQKSIRWDKVGQKEQVRVGEEFNYYYGKANPENTKVVIDFGANIDSYFLELVPFSRSDKEFAELNINKAVSDSIADYYRNEYDRLKRTIQLIKSSKINTSSVATKDTTILERINNTVAINDYNEKDIGELSSPEIAKRYDRSIKSLDIIEKEIESNKLIEKRNRDLINQLQLELSDLENIPFNNNKRQTLIRLIDSLHSINNSLVQQNDILNLDKKILEKDKLLFENEIESQIKIRNYSFAISILAITFLAYYFYSYRKKRKLNTILQQKNEIIEIERKKSDDLLLNVLPYKIAERLKNGAKTISDLFDEVSVVFIDITQFTYLSKDANPERIVEVLNKVYTTFDRIAEKYQLEKIKTIGDCYMAAAGIPEPIENNELATANFSIEVMSLMKNYDTGDGTILEFKIGIDCGPVVAGVIGKKKFIYDLWGDTVNTASRMEEYGESGKIQVTERFKNKLTQDGIGDQFVFEERDAIEIKGKGKMKTWFLTQNNDFRIMEGN